MKRWVICILLCAVTLTNSACAGANKQPNIAATTLPVYTFTQALCQGTPLTVGQLIQENVSCLHDYTLTVKHMKILEGAEMIIMSGGNLEDFLHDALPENAAIIDASSKIQLDCGAAHHDDHHDADPHYWLSISKAQQMAHTICDGLIAAYPQYTEQFQQNLEKLDKSFLELQNYAQNKLADLNCRQLITFHDGFHYLAEEFNLTILHAVEEESGSEASAKDLIHICKLVSDNNLPAIFTEKNGSNSAANIISRQTGAKIFSLDMAISGNSYFDAMYHNIDTLKEALG